MQLKYIAQLFIVVSSIGTSVQAIGINCNGSAYCTGFSVGDAAAQLNNFIQNISNGAWYNNGQQIACVTKSGQVGGICAFLQKTGGTNGQILKQLAPEIVYHGCKKCGNVPYYYPQGDNNVDNGMLTFNYVDKPCRVGSSGLC